MLDIAVSPLPSYTTQKRHSLSGLSSGAFMTVQMHIAHSSAFIGAGVIAGGPYRSAETFAATPMAPTSCMLNALYVGMTPLTPGTAPDPGYLVDLARRTENIDDLAHIADQRVYVFTGSCDRVVNQYAVESTRAFYEALGVTGDNLMFVDDIPAGHSIITMNPEDSPLGTNQPPYINRGEFIQSHQILDHLYPGAKRPAKVPSGDFIRFDQTAFLAGAAPCASMAEFGYIYVPSRVVAREADAIGVHIVLHGCQQGYGYTGFVNGRPDTQNQPPYGDRYMRTTGYTEWAEANDLILLFPQAIGGDNNDVQNPEGCWDWWGYSASDPYEPDYYSRDAVQIRAIFDMLTRLGGV